MAVRNEKGQFIKGHSGNPRGRPIDQFKYQKKIDTATTLKDWREIIEKAIEQAKRGDAKARQWLSDYLAGKPIQGIDVTSAGESIVDSKDRDRALSALADAIREGLFGESPKEPSSVDAPKQKTVASPTDES